MSLEVEFEKAEERIYTKAGVAGRDPSTRQWDTVMKDWWG